ncbi:SUV3 family DEAD/DEAH box RNA helicase [Lachnoclostridium sp. An138]|uniref:SUV3 family DEAD/DEAH box RNA helicase n=1 Tax=Lachnoclostridium sp. An138 TaxID=1965560 RepID=UPI001FA8DEB6|nr:DEAD/DEAH box helicase [Lachnoclostridium sp. An138]
MIQKKKLNQFYIEEYERAGRKKSKNSVRDSVLQSRVKNLQRAFRRARPYQTNSQVLEDLHRQLKNVAAYAYRKNRRELIEQINTEMIPKLTALDLGLLLEEQREGINGEFLAWLRRTMPEAVCSETLFTLYPKFRRYKVRNRILELVPARPEMEFAEVRELRRHFIFHIGPTNSGKTFQALERLKEAACGVYLGPLRLLALEVYERMNEMGVPCTMRTGQECIEEENSRVTASTIEMADFDENYDIAVIDEAQLVADTDRGHSWTKAVLGLRAEEIHICMSPAAEQVICHLVGLCGDDYEVRRYERKTELICEDRPFVFPDDVREGDALIAFSKKSVLDVAGRLEEAGVSSSVIYGSLPPEIRRRQTRLFNRGKTKVAVATDAIGMGLNLPVRRIVFLQADKFDGTSRRPLRTPEIKQIAGRAGRYGIYDKGYVSAMGEQELEYIRERFEAPEEPLTQVNLGFPQVLLDINAPLDELMKIWYSVTPSEPFVKENIDEALYLYEQAKKCRNMIDGFENKHLLYRMITCPIDIKDRKVVALWLNYCKTWSADVSLERPVLRREKKGGILQYETYYKQLDLYYQFSHRMQKEIDEEWLAAEREKTEMQIMNYLAKGKQNYIARCRYCGKLLPLGSPFQVCDRCYERK